MKKRTGDPWMSASEYGRTLPAFAVNLLVRDVARSLQFYQDVLGALVQYSDVDFAALKAGGVDLMLHADHTYDEHPWYERLAAGEGRGLGAELRLLGIEPETIEESARRFGAKVVRPVTERGHGWREVMVEDPDGYVWAIGVLSNREARA